MQLWESLKGGTGQGRASKVRRCLQALTGCWSQICHLLGLTVLFRKLWLEETLFFCPSELQNDKIEALLVNIWPHHAWVESINYWHFAPRNPMQVQTDCLIYGCIVSDFLARGTQSPLENEEWAVSLCITLDSWIWLVIIIEGWI